jgi:hypothetical protein
VSLASIAEFIGALTTVLPQRALTVTLAGVPIGAGVFAIVGTDPTVQGELQVALGCFRPRAPRSLENPFGLKNKQLISRTERGDG